MSTASPEPMVSYAQNLEDVLLERVFRGQPTGYYVDIGASDPTIGSVTRHFHDKGWHGINVEPGAIFRRLRAERPGDVNLQVAVSDRCGRTTLYESVTPGTETSSSLDPVVPEALRVLAVRREAREVETLTLGAIFERHAPDVIDFMSVDVEGHEREVLAGNDWARWRPRVLLVEATLPCTSTPCHERWEDIVIGAHYAFAAFDGVNRWYVREEDAALLARFAAPVNVLDGYVTAETYRLRALEHSLGDVGTRALRIGLSVARCLHRLRRPRA